MKFLGFKRIMLQSGEKVVVPESEVWIARSSSGNGVVNYKNVFSNYQRDYNRNDSTFPPGVEFKNSDQSAVILWAKVFSSENSIVINLNKFESINVPNDEVWLIPRLPFTYMNVDGDKLNGNSIDLTNYKSFYPGSKIRSYADKVVFVAFRSKKLGGVNV